MDQIVHKKAWMLNIPHSSVAGSYAFISLSSRLVKEVGEELPECFHAVVTGS